jgi:hypothetical protein
MTDFVMIVFLVVGALSLEVATLRFGYPSRDALWSDAFRNRLDA